MALEMEVKVLNVDLDEMEERLISLGAERLKSEVQKNYLIDDREQTIEKNQGGYLRLRESHSQLDDSKKLTLTYKENLDNDRLRTNIERDVSIGLEDKDELLRILAILGYDQVSLGIKERRSYLLKGMKFDLDSWDEATYPYDYMEIEVEDEDDLEEAIKLLDLNREDISRESITELREKLNIG